MCYRKHLRPLLTLELKGFVALTLHTVTETLTVPIERAVGAQVADTLREALRERRDGGENAYRQDEARAVGWSNKSGQNRVLPFARHERQPCTHQTPTL